MRKRRLLFGVLAAVLLAGAAAVLLPWRPVHPHTDFLLLQQRFFAERLLNRAEAALDVLGTGRFSGALHLTAQVDSERLDRLLEQSSLSLAVEVDRDRLLLRGEGVLRGSPVLDGALRYDRGAVEFSFPQADGNRYTADLSRLLTSLLGRPVDLSRLSLPDLSGSRWRALLQSYGAAASCAVTRDNVTLERGCQVPFRVLGGSFTGRVYTFTPAAADVEAALSSLAERLERDEELRALLLQLADPVEAASGGALFGDAAAEDGLDGLLVRLARRLEERAPSLGRQAEERGAAWTLGVEDGQVRLIRLEAGGSALVYERSGSEAEGGEEALYLDWGGSIDPLLRQSWDALAGTRRGSVSFRLPRACLERLGVPGSPQVTVDYQVDGRETSPLGLPYGSYDCTLENLELRFRLEVEDSPQGGSRHVLTCLDPSGVLFGHKFHQLTVTLHAARGSTIQPPSGVPVEITGCSEAELHALLDRLAASLRGQVRFSLVSGLLPWGRG